MEAFTSRDILSEIVRKLVWKDSRKLHRLNKKFRATMVEVLSVAKYKEHVAKIVNDYVGIRVFDNHKVISLKDNLPGFIDLSAILRSNIQERYFVPIILYKPPGKYLFIIKHSSEIVIFDINVRFNDIFLMNTLQWVHNYHKLFGHFSDMESNSMYPNFKRMIILIYAIELYFGTKFIKRFLEN